MKKVDNRKLNNFKFDETNYREAFEFLKFHIIPEKIEDQGKVNYFKNKLSIFFLKDDKIYYRTETRVLQVIKKDDVDNLIERFVKDFIKEGCNPSIIGVYSKIKKKYIGISRSAVKSFLERKLVHRLEIKN